MSDEIRTGGRGARCGNCAFWDPHGTYASSPFRPCRAIIHDENYRVGEGLAHKLDFDPEAELQERMAEDPDLRAEVEAMRKQHRAVVQDGSGFNAALKTREDFGCVLWKGK